MKLNFKKKSFFTAIINLIAEFLEMVVESIDSTNTEDLKAPDSSSQALPISGSSLKEKATAIKRSNIKSQP